MSNIIEDITNTLSGNDNISSVEYDTIMTALNVIKDKLDKYIPIIESNVIRLNLLNENVQSLDTTIINTNNTYKSLVATMKDVQDKANDKLDECNTKLDLYDNAIIQFNNTITSFDQTIRDHDTKIEQNSSAIDRNNTAINNVNNTIATNKNDIESKFNTYKDEVETYANKFNSYKEDNDEEITNINSNFESCKASVLLNKNNIESLQSTVTEINSHLDNHDNSLSTANQVLNAMQPRLNAVEEEVANNTTAIETNSCEIEKLRTSIDNNDSEISTLTASIADIESNAKSALDLSDQANAKAFEARSIANGAASTSETNATNIGTINTKIETINNTLEEHTEDIQYINGTITDKYLNYVDTVILKRLSFSDVENGTLLNNSIYFYNETYCIEQNINKTVYVDLFECRIIYADPDVKLYGVPDIIISPITKEININNNNYDNTSSNEKIAIYVRPKRNIAHIDGSASPAPMTSYPLPGDTINLWYKNNSICYLVKNVDFSAYIRGQYYVANCIRMDEVAIPAEETIEETSLDDNTNANIEQ